MTINFPSSPSVGQTYSFDGGTTWEWNGEGWALKSPAMMVNPMTAAGDLIAGGVAGEPLRVPIGTLGYSLVSNGAGVLPTYQKITGVGPTTATAAVAGGGSALPATPEGYISVVVSGVTYMMPYYLQVTTTWNPSDKSVDITLSGGNLTGTRSAAGNSWVSCRCNTTVTVKSYCELKVTAGAGSPGVMFGMARAVMSLASYVGADGNGDGYYSDNGNKFSSASTAYGSTYTVGDVIGMAYDPGTGTNGTVEFFKNNVSQGVAFTNLIPGMYPAFSVFPGSSATTIVGRFKAADFTYAPPTGFVAWA